MKQNNAKIGKMMTYPCSTAMQQVLDQEGEPSLSKKHLQGAWMDAGGVVLGGVV